MELDRILHLRALSRNPRKTSNHFNPDAHTVYDTTVQGVTVVGILVWNQEASRQDIVFSWAVQNPKDNYVKKEGVRVAEDRMRNGLIIQTNCDPQFPLKYQFFNAIANAHEFFTTEVMRPDFYENPNSEETYHKFKFIDLTIDALTTIADHNDWFLDVGTKHLPSIHPYILVKYIHKMNERKTVIDEVCDVLSRSPTLVNGLHMLNGVKL